MIEATLCQKNIAQSPSADAQVQPQILGQLGSLVTRLAINETEIREALQVRYTVFCEELNARTCDLSRSRKIEFDPHDAHFDHLLVIDQSDGNRIVGTQRICLQSSANTTRPLYTQNEFDIKNLIARHPDNIFMELGRSCILPEYRSRRTLELMWQGTWAYARDNLVDIMVGCASFPGTDIDKIAPELAFLASYMPLTPQWQVRAKSKNTKAIDVSWKTEIDPKAAIRRLPPLVKGYLRLGAMFSSEVVIDEEFNTTDILVVLRVACINPRYIRHYGEDAERYR